MRRALHFAAVIGLTGCIWSPTNRPDGESSATLPMSGYMLNANAAVVFQAKLATSDAMATIQTATASSSPSYISDGGDLYPWSATVPVLAPGYWSPQIDAGGLQYAPGRLEIFGTNGDAGGGFALQTFSGL